MSGSNSLLSFFRWSLKNTANDKKACQDDRVQVCLLQGFVIVFVEGISHFLLGKTSRISASRFSSS